MGTHPIFESDFDCLTVWIASLHVICYQEDFFVTKSPKIIMMLIMLDIKFLRKPLVKASSVKSNFSLQNTECIASFPLLVGQCGLCGFTMINMITSLSLSKLEPHQRCILMYPLENCTGPHSITIS